MTWISGVRNIFFCTKMKCFLNKRLESKCSKFRRKSIYLLAQIPLYPCIFVTSKQIGSLNEGKRFQWKQLREIVAAGSLHQLHVLGQTQRKQCCQSPRFLDLAPPGISPQWLLSFWHFVTTPSWNKFWLSKCWINSTQLSYWSSWCNFVVVTKSKNGV